MLWTVGDLNENVSGMLKEYRKTERQKDRKTERQKDRKTERQKDRKKERQTDRKTEESITYLLKHSCSTTEQALLE